MAEEHYLGNPLLKKTNTPVELSQEQLLELARCSEDVIYFAKNYIKIVTLDDGLVNFSPYKFQEEMLSNFYNKRFNVCKLPRQPLWIETPIPTPDGWKKIGDLKVGGYVYNPKGQPTKILKKSKRFVSAPCYKIHFSCGETIIADELHYWEVNKSEQEEISLMTYEIYDTFDENDPYYIKEAIIPEGYDKPGYSGDHYITKIEKTETVPTQCITVDCPSHLFLCGNNFIPTHNSGKSTTTVSFLVHCLVFEEHTSIAILANKASTAKDILGRLQTAYENLPKWMQQGVKSWNKTSMELENGSKVVAASTSASSVRGGTYSILMLDEYAFVPEHVADTFMKSVYPTITSGTNTKVIVVSCVTKDTYLLTPDGYKKIDRIVDTDKLGAYVVPEYQVMGKGQFYSSSVVVNQGRAPTNIIKTSYDEIECSEEHKLWAEKDCVQDYYKSKDLKVGDKVSVRFNTRIFGNKDNLDFTSSSGVYYEKVTPEIARLIGKNYLRNNNPDNELREILEHLGFDLSISSNKIILPDSVLSWSEKNIYNLLYGCLDVDCLGTAWCARSLKFTTDSKELLKQLKLLATNINLLTDTNGNEITFYFYRGAILPEDDTDLVWFEIQEITKSENEVFDVSLPDIDGDDWCHSVLYNNYLGHQTPCGMNHYYKLWTKANLPEGDKDKNEYHPFEIHWSDVPGRDENWKKTQIANIGQKAFDQEFNTDFLGSSNTLISASKLNNLVIKTPIRSTNNLDVYEDPKKDHTYVTIVDTAKGVEKDYSATVVVDVSTLPYTVVAKYRNNEIRPEMYSYVIKDIAMTYNESYLLCEVNDIGYQVARDLLEDSYPNMLMCSTKSRSGQFIGQNLSGKHEIGVKMQKNIKKVGSLNLKTLIEEDKLIINDINIFSELTTFVQKGITFEAESGRNDDLVDCLVIFAWLTTNQYFKDITDINLRKKLLEEKETRQEEDLLPFGFSPNSDVEEFTDGGLVWTKVEDDEMNALLNLFNYY